MFAWLYIHPGNSGRGVFAEITKFGREGNGQIGSHEGGGCYRDIFRESYMLRERVGV